MTLSQGEEVMFVIYIVDISKNMTSLRVRTRCNRRLKRPVVTFCQKRAVAFPFEKREDVSPSEPRAPEAEGNIARHDHGESFSQ